MDESIGVRNLSAAAVLQDIKIIHALFDLGLELSHNMFSGFGYNSSVQEMSYHWVNWNADLMQTMGQRG